MSRYCVLVIALIGVTPVFNQKQCFHNHTNGDYLVLLSNHNHRNDESDDHCSDLQQTVQLAIEQDRSDPAPSTPQPLPPVHTGKP